MKNLVINPERLLPWESVDEYETLVAELADEYAPEGPTERHLVDQIAGIIWRQRRVTLAENALHRKGLYDAANRGYGNSKPAEHAVAHLGDVKGGDLTAALTATDDDTAANLEGCKDARAETEKALAALDLDKGTGYEKALGLLSEGVRDWWLRKIEEDAERAEDNPDEAMGYTPDADGLWTFIEEEALTLHENVERGLTNRPLVRVQAYGESLDPEKHQLLARHEAHLDRKLERIIGLLLKLQNTRRKVAA